MEIVQHDHPVFPSILEVRVSANRVEYLSIPNAKILDSCMPVIQAYNHLCPKKRVPWFFKYNSRSWQELDLSGIPAPTDSLPYPLLSWVMNCIQHDRTFWFIGPLPEDANTMRILKFPASDKTPKGYSWHSYAARIFSILGGKWEELRGICDEAH